MRTDPIGDMVHNALTEAIEGVPIEDLEEMDTFSMEDKLILSHEEEEDYPPTKELTPGEISFIVNKALQSLPENLAAESVSEISDVCFDVAYEVIQHMVGD